MNKDIPDLGNQAKAIQKADFALVKDIASRLLDLQDEKMDSGAIDKCIAHIRKTAKPDEIADDAKLERKHVFSFFHKQISPDEKQYHELVADKTFNPDPKIEYIRETFAPHLRDLRYKQIKDADFSLVKGIAKDLLGLEDDEIDRSAIYDVMRVIRGEDLIFDEKEGKPIHRASVFSYFDQELGFATGNTRKDVKKQFQKSDEKVAHISEKVAQLSEKEQQIKPQQSLMQRLTSWFNALTSNNDENNFEYIEPSFDGFDEFIAEYNDSIENRKNLTAVNKHEEFKLVQKIAEDHLGVDNFDSKKTYQWIKDQKRNAGIPIKSRLSQNAAFKLFQNAINQENGDKGKVKAAFANADSLENIPVLKNPIDKSDLPDLIKISNPSKITKIARVSGEFSKGSVNSTAVNTPTAKPMIDRGSSESRYEVGESDMSREEFDILLTQQAEKNKIAAETSAFDSVVQSKGDIASTSTPDVYGNDKKGNDKEYDELVARIREEHAPKGNALGEGRELGHAEMMNAINKAILIP